ncbi:hypothetical protein F0365_11775 [Nonlabens sp. Ci31]|jgi:hypothetical protein|uniref:hypothetical protein n=1 Tax=Nonlabens sp. Ci31 TaxID=2608253 RepID=UPI0014631D5D|nr:hypothetical protein [Nonlabens sp. Ci31]QJP35017.1 hypothetical protein F0365_11775 [Nonlabens sp. Ci31]
MKFKLSILSLFLILVVSCKEKVDKSMTLDNEKDSIEKSPKEVDHDRLSTLKHDPISGISMVAYDLKLNQEDSSIQYLIDKQYGVKLQINWELNAAGDHYVAKSGLLTTSDLSINLLALNYCSETQDLTYFYSKKEGGANELILANLDQQWLTYKGSEDKIFRFDTTDLISYSSKPCDNSHDHQEGSHKEHKSFDGIKAHDITSTGGVIISSLP